MALVLALLAAEWASADEGQPSEPDKEGIRLVTPGAGGGFSLPGGLWVAGDITLSAEVPENDLAKTEIDDLSLLLRYEPLPRLAFFSEIRLEDSLELVESEGVTRGPADLSVRRLYADWLITPRFTLRAGKFLMPFGLWNVIHRAPLTWTVDEPAVFNEDVFPKLATGLSLIYQTTWHGWTLDATGYGPAQDKLAFRKTRESGLLFGGRAALGHSVGSAFVAGGLSAAWFGPEQRRTEAYGVDLDVSVLGHHLTAEFAQSRLPAGFGGDEHGAYLQDVVPLPLVDRLYGVVRFEYFQPPQGRAAAGQLVGLFWQPIPYLILKADYQFTDRELETLVPGFIASISLIF